ncbi:MAG: alpha/beta fold hydrolase [Ammonifex sp.]|nr:MAG: alpha/beta fold hydrolase [Ammonifex sp.]
MLNPWFGRYKRGISLKQTEVAGAPAYLLSPGAVKESAVVIHGYGGNKEEVVGLGMAVAGAGYRVYLPDLPGHGMHPRQLAENVVRDFVAALKTYGFKAAVGHSLGGRVAMVLGVKPLCLLSLPLAARFEGRKSDLLRVLRARRVRESKPFGGLAEVLAALTDPWPDPPVLLFYAFQDLPTCLEAAAKGRQGGWETRAVKTAGHLDIVSAPEVLTAVKSYLEKERAVCR